MTTETVVAFVNQWSRRRKLVETKGPCKRPPTRKKRRDRLGSHGFPSASFCEVTSPVKWRVAEVAMALKRGLR
jgi:hypothetical protein